MCFGDIYFVFVALCLCGFYGIGCCRNYLIWTDRDRESGAMWIYVVFTASDYAVSILYGHKERESARYMDFN